MRPTFALFTFLIGCTAEIDEAQRAAILEIEGDPTAAEETYTAECSGCHGEDGAGGHGGELGGQDEDTIVDALLSGPGGMPCYADVW